MYCNPISTKRLKLDGVGPVDNRPSTNKDGGPIHLWGASCAHLCRVGVMCSAVLCRGGKSCSQLCCMGWYELSCPVLGVICSAVMCGGVMCSSV